MGCCEVKESVTPPKVSVTVITYNHGDWLGQCLESIVSQITDFSFEVIVGDDASTDIRTVEILRDFKRKYGEMIVPVYRHNNSGGTANYFEIVSLARGEYIAHIDGDDFMLPGKLQKQVDYLDKHSDVVIATHEMCSVVDCEFVHAVPVREYPELGTVYDLLFYGTYFCHSSKMYRRSAIVTHNSDKPVVDYYFHIEHAMSGKIYYTKEILGGHRLHSKGISINKSYRSILDSAYQSAYDRASELGLDIKEVERGRVRYSHGLALMYLDERDFNAFRNFGKINTRKLKHASAKQLVVHILSYIPLIAYGLFGMRRQFLKFLSKIRLEK